MLTSRTRRLRLSVFLAVGVFTIWIWSRNSAIVDTYRRYGAGPAVGGGSVLRPDLQRPEMHEELKEDLKQHLELSDQQPPPDDVDDALAETTPPTKEDAPSIDDLLHSDPAMQSQKPVEPSETTTSSTSAAAITSKPAVPADAAGDGFGYNPNGAGYGRVEVSINPKTTISAAHWSKPVEHFPISSTIQLPTGTSVPFPRIQREVSKLSANGADEERLRTIKEAAEHSWKGYRLFAFQQDEVRPVSHTASNPFNGWGATLVDALDTLWVMGMEKEFEEAVQAVAQIDFTTSPRSDIPLFETVIRYLGGLVAAYDVSGKKYITLLDKAVELAEVLYGAFDTPNRVPMTYYRWKPYNTVSPKRASTRVILAEVGTLSMEFTRLAQLTGEPKYYDAVARLTDMFEEWQNSTRLPGMWPTYFDSSGCGEPEPLEAPLRSPHTEQTVPDTVAEELLDSENLRHQPGALEDDGMGKHEAEDQLFNEDMHGNTYKKRQIESGRSRTSRYGDNLPPGSVIQNGMDHANETHEIPAAQKTGDSVVEDSDTAATTEHELRAPPVSPGSITPPVRSDDKCTPQGFVSSSVSGNEIFTLSGMSDSMYEYLPKEYMLLGGQVDKYRTMYLDSAEVAIKKLLYKPMTEDERDILVAGALSIQPNYSQPRGERDYIEKFNPEIAHLACFAGGMFAMGGVLFDKPEHVKIGSKLTDGCVWAYNVTGSGIMPEGAQLMACEDTWGECKWNETAYFEKLDPYESSRLTTPTVVSSTVSQTHPQPVPPDSAHGGDSGHRSGNEDHRETLSEHSSTESGTTDASTSSRSSHAEYLSEHAHDETRDTSSNINKRQLDSPPSSSSSANQRQQQPSPPSSADTPSTSEPGSSSSQHSSNTLPSHADYARQKILSDRLPTGFTHISSRKYILRPEAIESVFYMYRITGDLYWREVGWNMWRSIEKFTKAPFGFSAVDDVTKTRPDAGGDEGGVDAGDGSEEIRLLDQMESFWLAETLKYFYLLFDLPERWSLDEWVFNTEAHLFRRPDVKFVEAT